MRLALALLAFLVPATAQAETANVAVAANFAAVAEVLAQGFQSATGHQVALSFGATGQLFAQISQGAPFQVFLAADTERPQRAIAEGLAVYGSFFVYAEGRLALYGAGQNVTDQAALTGDFDKLAIADPQTAPYGQAAVETLAALGLSVTLTSRLVIGESISQALQFVESGNAELGFVAASQVIGKPHWLVPTELHQPIAQGAVLLNTGAGNAAAESFLTYLGSDAAVAVIEAAGYSVPR